MANVIELNGRRYHSPKCSTVVICVDGCDPEYLERGIPDGVFPTIGSFRHRGYLGAAAAAMPTFTNPNNVSIVTGAPPSVHGIAGNYYLDRETGREIMMTDERLMRSETILALMAAAGVKTAAITAKDKLRRLLGRNLDGICFSSECAGPEMEAMVGRARPDMYSADLSLFVLDAGIALLERGAAELLYLSLSDYVQHAHAPGDPTADAFHHEAAIRTRRHRRKDQVEGRTVQPRQMLPPMAIPGFEVGEKAREIIFLGDSQRVIAYPDASAGNGIALQVDDASPNGYVVLDQPQRQIGGCRFAQPRRGETVPFRGGHHEVILPPLRFPIAFI